MERDIPEGDGGIERGGVDVCRVCDREEESEKG